MRTTRADLDRGRESESSQGHAADQRVRSSLTSLQGVSSVGTSWLPEEDMGRRSPLSEYMSLQLSLNYQQTVGPFRE